jgi:hypothetical protein
MKFLLQGLTVGLCVAIFLSFKQAKDAKKEGNQKLEKTHKMIGVFCCVGLAVVFGLNIVWALKPEKTPLSWKTEDNTTMAYVMMQNFVKD